MMRQVIRDYFTAFRWQKIKETYKYNNWWLFIYSLTFLPMGAQTKESALTYLLILIPFLFCMFSASLHPMFLPKIMYLCPMSTSTRREYVVKSGFFQISVSVAVGTLGVLGLLICGISDWISGAGIWLNHAIFSVFLGSGANPRGYGKISETGQRVVDMDSKQGILEFFNILIAILLSTAYIFMLSWDTSPAWWVKWIFIGISIFIQLPFTLNYLKYWPKTVDEIMLYENSGKGLEIK